MAGLVHGIHAVTSLLQRRPGAVQQAILQQGIGGRRRAAVEATLARQRIPIEYVSRQQLDALTGGAPHQGVALKVRRPGVLSEAHFRDLVAERGADLCVVVLDGVQDPRNLGACLRSAAAAGADAVVIPRDRAAGLTPAAVKAASGAAELVPVVRVTNLARLLRRLAQAGVQIIGLAGDSGTALYDVELQRPLALVLGGEARGLRRLTRECCDAVVAIPTAAGVESLNVAAAAAVALFELHRQSRAGLVPTGSVS